MNYLLKSIIFLTLTALIACTEQRSEPATQEQEPEPLVFTHYTDTTELFVEFSVLIVGQSSSFAAHFSRMSDFLPVETGAVSVILSGGGHPVERFSIDSAAVPGIFIPKAEPKYAGQRQLTIALKSATLNVKHELGEVTVYPDLKTALAVVHDEDDESEDISFLKEQQWKVNFATEVIVQHELQKSVRALGTIKAAANNESYISAPISGHLLTPASALPQVGMQVIKGQVLATLSARLSGVSDIVELQMGVQTARAH
ncbi:MAG: efflux RND transporter periplasmic adaptor subunit, partial [Methyloprofundus sp.]|nr:efflux RND transporter periplasmic adaptor subunit [Methyloprofundus sp.]